MIDAATLRALEAIAPISTDEPLSRHTTIGVGGPADAYAVATSARQIQDLLNVCRDAALAFFILGSGSNIVVGDRGIRGLTIENKAVGLTRNREPGTGKGEPDGRLRETASVSATPASTSPASPSPWSERGPWDESGAPERYLLRADSGCSFALTSRHLSFDGLEGLEWACGIPGTIGGAVVYNAGAYGGCLGDVLQRIAVWDPADGECIIEASDLGLVYRGSAFTKGLMAGRAVLWAEFVLWQGDEPTQRARIADYDGRRLKAQPRGRNAGSFFKNPPEQPAWKLIDAIGMRGYQIGGARFSDKHCNFLINAGEATAADIAALKSEAQRRIFDQFGITITNEVTLVGEGFGDQG